MAAIVSGPVRLSVPACSREPALASLRDAFAGDERAIEVGLSLQDPAIDRDALSGSQQDRHARLDLVQSEDRSASPSGRRTSAPRAARRARPLHGGSGSFPHHVIERASDQQEEQQRDRGVEIGMRPAVEPSRTGSGRTQAGRRWK